MPSGDGSPAFECRWDELTPEQLGAAAVLGLDANSWQQWVRPELLPAKPGEDDEGRRMRSFDEALEKRWPDCTNKRGWDVVRHSALTWQTWEELGVAEQEAAALLSYTPEVWESFHCRTRPGPAGRCA
eukprot:2966407-Rhodomonas_salina.1